MGSALRRLEQGGISALLSLTSLVIFVALFIGLVYWTMSKSHDESFEQARNLPFNDENEGETPGEETHE